MNRSIGDISFNGVAPTLGGVAIATLDDITALQLTYQIYSYVATIADQTTFSGLDTQSNTLSYSFGKVLVIANGIVLNPIDYTATNGTSVVLTVGVPVGTEIVIQAFGDFNIGPPSAKYVYEEIIATASQTVFPIAGGYVPNQLTVSLNGTQLTRAAADVSSGTNVVLSTGATVSDVLIVSGFKDGITFEGLLTNLNDVDVIENVSDGSVLTYNNGTSLWNAKTLLEANIQPVVDTVQIMPATTVNGAIGNWQTRSMPSNEAWLFSITQGQSIFVTVTTNGFTLNLTNVNKWVGGAAPATIEPEHAFRFWSNDGTTIIGHSLGGIA